MTMNNPKQVNRAEFYVDERNQWCDDCALRLAPDEAPGTMIAPHVRPYCTECEAFAAGTHPELRKEAKDAVEFTKDEQEAILKAIDCLVGESFGYLEDGNLQVDHGSEANSICDLNIKRYITLAGICTRMGDGTLAHECLDLAEDWEEHRNDETK